MYDTSCYFESKGRITTFLKVIDLGFIQTDGLKYIFIRNILTETLKKPCPLLLIANNLEDFTVVRTRRYRRRSKAIVGTKSVTIFKAVYLCENALIYLSAALSRRHSRRICQRDLHA